MAKVELKQPIVAEISEGIKEAVNEKGALGILTGGLTAAAGGITVALLCGFLASLIFRSRPKG